MTPPRLVRVQLLVSHPDEVAVPHPRRVPRFLRGRLRQQQQNQHHVDKKKQQRQSLVHCADQAAEPRIQEEREHGPPAQALVPQTPPHRAPLRRLRRGLRWLVASMSPQGPGINDKTLPERVMNVATCGMFFQAGGKIIRICKSLAARRFGWAFMAVGVVATVYHASWGRFRPLARKVDYYSIAASSLLLRASVCGPVPGWLTAAMLAAAPFRPSLVSSSNFAAVEVRYMLLALAQPHLAAEWAAHLGLTLAATAAFTLDETPLLSWFPYTHAAFHALSAAAFLTLPRALDHLAQAAAVAAVAVA